MRYVKEEITKEKYELLKSMPYNEQHKELFPNGLPVDWECGYGYYGHAFKEENGRYYVFHTLGSTCD